MTKHIWHLCSDFDQSIWTNWVRSYLVRDRNFWSLRPPGDCSWTWRKIINLRNYYRLALVLRSRVLDNFSFNDGRVTWNMSPNGVFTTKSAWDFFRDKGAPVPWHKIILFSGMVPRHAMILWLVARGRLNTLDRLASFGISQSLTRPLCNGDNENLSHVLFSCQFYNRIWHSLFGKCNLPCSYSCWEDLFLDVANRFKGKSLRDLIVKLMLAAGVYIIWKERNSRLFMGKFRDVTNVYLDIVLHVRLRINSLSGFPPSCVNRWVVSSWGIAENILHNL
jgi:hypothetical protein